MGWFCIGLGFVGGGDFGSLGCGVLWNARFAFCYELC